MISKTSLFVAVCGLWFGLLASISAQAQIQLQSRSSNLPDGNITCTGQDIDLPIDFTGTAALPGPNNYIVGASFLLSLVPSSGIQHAFVSVDPNSILGAPPGFVSNGQLVHLGFGEVHQTFFFPLSLIGTNEVAGYKVNNTPRLHVFVNCSAGQFQGHVIFWFLSF